MNILSYNMENTDTELEQAKQTEQTDQPKQTAKEELILNIKE